MQGREFGGSTRAFLLLNARRGAFKNEKKKKTGKENWLKGDVGGLVKRTSIKHIRRKGKDSR